MILSLCGSLGVPLGQMRLGSRFPLQVRTRRSSSLAGFPLQSLTRILLLLSICLTSCDQSKPFDKDGWQKKLDWDYPNRNAMVQDLLDNHKLSGLSTRAITELLGQPDHLSTTDEPQSISYQVVMDFGWDIDPVHTKNLVLEFNKDSVVTKVDLLEWKKP